MAYLRWRRSFHIFSVRKRQTNCFWSSQSFMIFNILDGRARLRATKLDERRILTNASSLSPLLVGLLLKVSLLNIYKSWAIVIQSYPHRIRLWTVHASLCIHVILIISYFTFYNDLLCIRKKSEMTRINWKFKLYLCGRYLFLPGHFFNNIEKQERHSLLHVWFWPRFFFALTRLRVLFNCMKPNNSGKWHTM